MTIPLESTNPFWMIWLVVVFWAVLYITVWLYWRRWRKEQ